MMTWALGGATESTDKSKSRSILKSSTCYSSIVDVEIRYESAVCWQAAVLGIYHHTYLLAGYSTHPGTQHEYDHPCCLLWRTLSSAVCRFFSSSSNMGRLLLRLSWTIAALTLAPHKTIRDQCHIHWPTKLLFAAERACLGLLRILLCLAMDLDKDTIEFWAGHMNGYPDVHKTCVLYLFS